MRQELDKNQICLDCYEVKPIEQGEAVVRFGSYIEFTCYKCKAERKLCGACGQYFLKDEADELGYHLAKFCDASSECDICGRKENLYTEQDKKELQKDWAGINFYENVCRSCFSVLEGII